MDDVMLVSVKLKRPQDYGGFCFLFCFGLFLGGVDIVMHTAKSFQQAGNIRDIGTRKNIACY